METNYKKSTMVPIAGLFYLKKFLRALALCLFFIFILCACSRREPEGAPPRLGNTAGNVSNLGLAATDGEWIYYANFGADNFLYKINADGSDKTCLNSRSSMWLNVSGEWIYYYCHEDSYLYKIRTNGTEETRITGPEEMFRSSLEHKNSNEEELMMYAFLGGDWIYYTVSANDDFGSLYRMRTDGSEITYVNAEPSVDINFVGDWVYYISRKDDKFYLYKIRKDGEKRALVQRLESYFTTIADDWIYYIDPDENIYKMRMSGKGKQLITEGPASWLNVAGDWIYYQNLSDTYLYRVKTDGTEKTLLNEDACMAINVVGDWIYYISTKNGEIMKIRTDGTEWQKA